MKLRRVAFGSIFFFLLLVVTCVGLEIGGRVFVAIQGRQLHDEQLARLEAFTVDKLMQRVAAPKFALNLLWGFGHAHGFGPLDYFEDTGAPYNYPLSKEEFVKRVGDITANNFGFEADRDYPADLPSDAYVVGLFGGSVAEFLYAVAREDLQQELSRALGRKVVVLNFALSAAKQPQQLDILTFFMALGQRFDLVLNLDGINEAWHPALNAQADISAGFPVYSIISPVLPEISVKASEYVVQAQRLVDLLGLLQSVVRWNHATVNSRFVDLVATTVFGSEEQRLHKRLMMITYEGRPKMRPRTVTLPRFSRLFDTDDPVEQGLRIWMESARMMAQVAHGRGAEYIEFIQPSPHVTKKEFTKEERAVGLPAKDELMSRGYARLLAKIDDLRSAGIKIHSLADLFEETREPVYVDNCCHVNVLGNRMMVDAIVARLRTELASRQ